MARVRTFLVETGLRFALFCRVELLIAGFPYGSLSVNSSDQRKAQRHAQRNKQTHILSQAFVEEGVKQQVIEMSKKQGND